MIRKFIYISHKRHLFWSRFEGKYLRNRVIEKILISSSKHERYEQNNKKKSFKKFFVFSVINLLSNTFEIRSLDYINN